MTQAPRAPDAEAVVPPDSLNRAASSEAVAAESRPLAPERSPPPAGTESLAWLRETPFWALSAFLHFLLFLLLLQIVVSVEKEEDAVMVAEIRLPPRQEREPPYDRKAERDWEKRVRARQPQLELPKWQRRGKQADLPDAPIPQIRERIASPLEPTPIGVDGFRAPGAFGIPIGTALEDGGGDADTESAVRAALEWLVRHQSPDGRWKSADFVRQCKEPCRNLNPARYGDGRGFPEHDVGVTGLAVLALAGHGHTHRNGIHPHFVEALRRALDYLLSVQVRSDDPTTHGRIGPAEGEAWIYDHAIATLALGELLVTSRDLLNLRAPVEDAVRLCLRAQNPGAGWRYGIRPGSNDTSVTGWMCLALKTARHARLSVPREEFDRAFAGALRWIDRVTALNGRTGYYAPGDEGSRLQKGHPEPYPYSKELSCMTGVGVLTRLLAGESRKSPAVRAGVRILLAHRPLWQEARGAELSTINFYYWYYGSYALFQHGGSEWNEWNVKMKDALVRTQRRGGDEDGSWDPVGEWGIAGGRVYATAIGAMTLEVYYRYLRLQNS